MWMSLPVWLRLCIAFVLFGIGGLFVYSAGPFSRWVGWKVGFAVIGLGFAALIFSTKTNSEKKGYRF